MIRTLLIFFVTCLCVNTSHSEWIYWYDDTNLPNLSEEPFDRAEKVRQEKDIHEIVGRLLELRNAMIIRGYHFPTLRRFLERCRSAAVDYGLEVDDAFFERLCKEFEGNFD